MPVTNLGFLPGAVVVRQAVKRSAKHLRLKNEGWPTINRFGVTPQKYGANGHRVGIFTDDDISCDGTVSSYEPARPSHPVFADHNVVPLEYVLRHNYGNGVRTSCLDFALAILPARATAEIAALLWAGLAMVEGESRNDRELFTR